jgi:hypothetical protein
MEIGNINELNMAKTASIFFPNGKDNVFIFVITTQFDEGYN